MDRPDDATAAVAALTPEEFRDVIGRFASGVTVITATRDGTPLGATASAVSSLSLEPPMLLVCLRQGSSTGAAIAATRRFAVNVLSEEQAEHAMRFARPSADRFADVEHDATHDGIPLLRGALATFECTVTEAVAGGTHTVFLARVERAHGRDGTPLAYYRGQFGRLELVQDQAASDEIERVMASVRTRYALLVGALALARERPDEQELAQLRELARASTPPAAPRDAAAYVEARAALGEALVERSGGPLALDAFRRADVPGLIERLWSGPAAPSTAQREQLQTRIEELLDAIERGDREALVTTSQALVDLYGDLYAAAVADGLEI